MQDKITFWKPEQKTFYYLNLKTLRSIIAWGYDLTYGQTEHIGYLDDGEYWCCIDADLAIEGEDIRSQIQEGFPGFPEWNDILIDLAASGQIPAGDYLLSVY